jgi:hypothetical protein
MDREHVKGAADQAKGAIKDTAVKVTSDKELQAEVKFDKPLVVRCQQMIPVEVPDFCDFSPLTTDASV